MEEPVLSPEEMAGLERYYRAEYASMLKFSICTLHDENLAQVAVQETFVIASRKYSELTGSQKPVGWLYNVLKNVIRQIIRERKAMLERYVELSPTNDPSVEMEQICCLDVNKNDDLRLLSRFYVEGYSLEEVAKELKISVPALKMRMCRAKKRLREDPEINDMKNF